MKRHTVHPAIFALCMSIIFAPGAASMPIDANDPLYEDLGFTSNRQNVQIGKLLQRAYSWRDSDASFMINDVTLAYKRPPCTMRAPACEERLQTALARARANRTQDWRSLGMLLEASAAFYRKMNLAGESLSLLTELVALLAERAPGTDELCLAQVAHGQTACATNRYADAERSFNSALYLARQLHSSDDENVLEIQAHLYYLYFDINRADKAVRCRKELIVACGRDYIAERERSQGSALVSTWPDILRGLDAVATSHEIADFERDADAEAMEALERANRGGPVATAQPPAPPASSTGDNGEPGEKEPPVIPYRIYRGRDAH